MMITRRIAGIAGALAICAGVGQDRSTRVNADGFLGYETVWDSCLYWYAGQEMYAAIMINMNWYYVDTQSRTHVFSGFARASDGHCPGDVLDFEGGSQYGYTLLVTNATHAEVYDDTDTLVYSN